MNPIIVNMRITASRWKRSLNGKIKQRFLSLFMLIHASSSLMNMVTVLCMKLLNISKSLMSLTSNWFTSCKKIKLSRRRASLGWEFCQKIRELGLILHRKSQRLQQVLIQRICLLVLNLNLIEMFHTTIDQSIPHSIFLEMLVAFSML